MKVKIIVYFVTKVLILIIFFQHNLSIRFISSRGIFSLNRNIRNCHLPVFHNVIQMTILWNTQQLQSNISYGNDVQVIGILITVYVKQYNLSTYNHNDIIGCCTTINVKYYLQLIIFIYSDAFEWIIWHYYKWITKIGKLE